MNWTTHVFFANYGMYGYLRFPLGRAEVSMEHATCHERRSMSQSDIWDDDRNYHDEGMVLLLVVGRCQRAVQFHCRTYVYIFNYFRHTELYLGTESARRVVCCIRVC